jgi:hypothetical protein
VDYANETLTFYDSEGFAYTGDGAALDAPLTDNTFIVEATLDGVYTGSWMLDLGAGGNFFDGKYAMAHGLGRPDGVLQVGFGAGGRMLHRRARYETFEFGGYPVGKPEISVSDFDPDFRVELEEGQRAGILGNTLFRHFVLYLDYERQQVIVEKGDDFGKSFPQDTSGLSLWRPEKVCEVLFVAPGTPAEEGGFREGDVVVSVDGTGVEQFDGLVELRGLLREEPGTEHILVVERDGETAELKLVLRDLLESSEE